MRAAFLVLLAATTVMETVHAVAGKLSIDSASSKFSVVSSAGTQLSSKPLSPTQKSSAVTLSATDTLKLAFQIVDGKSGKGVQPQQAFLRFYDESTGEEGIQPVKVTNSGKAKYELNMAKPPTSLPPTTSAPLSVTLLLGASGHPPASLDLFDLHVPASHPPTVHPDEASFHLLPEIQHTFRADPKLPPRAISAVAAGAVVAVPWIILIALWSTTPPRLPALFSASIVPFTLSLGAFEMLLFRYWWDLKLGDVITYGAILGVVTIFTGRQALAGIAEKRLGKGGK